MKRRVTRTVVAAVAVLAGLAPLNASGANTPGALGTDGVDLGVQVFGPAQAVVGETARFDVYAANYGPADATAVALTASIPAAFTIVDLSDPSCAADASNVVTCPLGDIAAAGSATVSVSTTPVTAGAFTVDASVSSSSVEVVPDAHANRATTTGTILDNRVDLESEVSGPAQAVVGESNTFTATVTNHGPAAAGDVLMAVSIPGSFTVVAVDDPACSVGAWNVVGCGFGDLDSSSYRRVEVSVMPVTLGAFTVTATVASSSSEIVPQLFPNTASVSGAIVANRVDLYASLSAPSQPVVGVPTTFYGYGGNYGPGTAHDVTLAVFIPAGFTIDAVSDPSHCTFDGSNAVICAVGDLLPGSSNSYGVSVSVLPVTTGTFTATAGISSSSTEVSPEAYPNGSSASGVISLDDQPPQVRPDVGIVVEGNAGTTDVVVPVRLSSPWATTVTVRWTTLFVPGAPGAQADPATDYAAARGTVTFAPGETSKTVSIRVNGDTLVEPGEYIVVSFSNPTNAVMGGYWGLGFAGILTDDASVP